MIELGPATSWEVPDVPAPPRRTRRWLVLAAVVLGLLALTAGAQPAQQLRAVFTLGGNVLDVRLAAHHVFVTRYQGSGTNPLQAYRPGDGALQWTAALAAGQSLYDANDDVVVLITESDDNGRDVSSLTVLSADTGRVRFSRTPVRLQAWSKDVMVVEDLTGIPAQTGSPQPDGPGNPPPPQRPLHYQMLSPTDGSIRWSLTVPVGGAVSFESEYPADPDNALRSVAELHSDGQLLMRDPVTGTVRDTYHLQWSGVPSMFEIVHRRAVLYQVGDDGSTVHDLATGRQLWRRDADPGQDMYMFGCSAELFCISTGHGLAGMSADTGAEIWRVDSYKYPTYFSGDWMAVTNDPEAQTGAANGAIVDLRSGRTIRIKGDWRVVGGLADGRLLVWQPAANLSMLLALLDPRSGMVTVVGRTGDAIGVPACRVVGMLAACTNSSTLTVWRLPARTIS